MTPLETIKTGILNNDMEEVIQGYMALTGEEVRPKPPKDGVPEVQQSAPVLVQQGRKMDFSTYPTASSGTKKVAGKSPVTAGSNQFVDDGVEHSDVETPDFTPGPRNREEAKTISVRCHVCGKDQEVNPVLAQGEFYRCDSCVGNK